MPQRSIARLAAAVVIFAATPLFAQETDWKVIYKDKICVVKIQLTSIKPTKRGAIAWFTTRLAKPQLLPTIETPVAIIKEKKEVSNTHQWVKRIIFQSSDGQVLRDHEFEEPGDSRELIPNSDTSDIALETLKLLKSKNSKTIKTK